MLSAFRLFKFVFIQQLAFVKHGCFSGNLDQQEESTTYIRLKTKLIIQLDGSHRNTKIKKRLADLVLTSCYE